MPNLFPFSPEASVIEETLFWSTLVARSRDTEVRTQIAPTRQMFLYTFRMDAQKFTKAEGIIEDDPLGQLYVPLWTDMSLVGDVTVGQTTFTVDPASDYEANQFVLIYQDDDTYELATVSSLVETTLTISSGVAASYVDAVAVPVRIGHAENGIEHSRNYAGDIDVKLQFELISNNETKTNPFTTYNTLPIFTPASYSFSPITGILNQQSRRVDDLVSFALLSTRNVSERIYGLSYKTETLAELKELREFLNFLGGKSGEFYLPRRSRDFVATGAISAGQTVVPIEPAYLTLAEYTGKHLCVDGTAFTTIASAANGSGTHDLTIAALGTSHGDPEISLMLRCRMEVDSVKIRHEATEAKVQIPVREVV